MCSSIAPLALGFSADAFAADETMASPFNRGAPNDAHGNLLDEIRRGVPLRHVPASERNTRGAGGSTLADAMRRVIDSRRTAFDSPPATPASPSPSWSDDESPPPTPIATRPASRPESAARSPRHSSPPHSPPASAESPSPRSPDASPSRTPSPTFSFPSPSRTSTPRTQPPSPLRERPERSPAASPRVASPRSAHSRGSTQPPSNLSTPRYEPPTPLQEDPERTPVASPRVASPRSAHSRGSTQPPSNLSTPRYEPPTPLQEDPERTPVASPHVTPAEHAQRRPFLLQKPPQVPSWRKKAPSATLPDSHAPARPGGGQFTTPASGAAKYVAVNSGASDAFAAGVNAVAIGADARAQGQESLATGWRAQADGHRAVATGARAIASGRDAVALGAGSIADRDNTVSVGQRGSERQIVHVAPGAQGTDAVNVDQLNLAISNSNAYTNQRIGDLQQSITETARDAYSGVAAATALTMIPDVDRDKMLSIGVGGAVYKGHRAVALGGTARIGENLKVRAGVAMSAGGNTVGVGMSWQW
ncbi:Hep_Hag family [Burkholderia thailandensis E264]|nr:Hep_Hag family [Burkholderia thailandensis E264]